MKGPDHRTKSLNGMSRYRKFRHKYDRHPRKKMIRGYKGSLKHAPEAPSVTLGDVWP